MTRLTFFNFVIDDSMIFLDWMSSFKDVMINLKNLKVVSVNEEITVEFKQNLLKKNPYLVKIVN